jgi:hypothetical protein
MSTAVQTRPITPAPPRSGWTWPIRISIVVLSLTLLAAGSASIVGSFFQVTRTTTRTFPAGVRQVQITSGTGDVTVRTGPTAATVLTNRLTSGFRQAEHSEKLVGGVLYATGKCRGNYAIADSCASDLILTVPSGTTVTVLNAYGDTTVNTTSTITVTSSSGDIHLTGGHGAIRATTKNGDVRGSRLAAGTVYARSSNGDVSLKFARTPGHVTALSQVADVDVVVPHDGTSYRVTAKAGVGERNVEVPTASASGRTIIASSSVGDVSVRTG